ASTTPEPSTNRLSFSEILPFTVPWMTRSSSPEISPSITMLEPMMVFAILFFVLSDPSDVVGQLDFHFDGAVEHRPVFNHHARRFHVAVHLGARVDRHARARVDVARGLAVDGELVGPDVGLHLSGAFDGEVILERDLPFDAALDDEVPASRQAPANHDALTDD